MGNGGWGFGNRDLGFGIRDSGVRERGDRVARLRPQGRKPGRRGASWHPAVPAFAALVPGYAGGPGTGIRDSSVRERGERGERVAWLRPQGRKPGRRGASWHPAVPAFAALVPGYAGGPGTGIRDSSVRERGERGERVAWLRPQGRKPGRRGAWKHPVVPAFAALVPGYADYYPEEDRPVPKMHRRREPCVSGQKPRTAKRVTRAFLKASCDGRLPVRPRLRIRLREVLT